MRKDPLITGEYYHIYNRGVDKRDIFMDMRNLRRFVLSVKKFNTIKPVGSIRETMEQERETKLRRLTSEFGSEVLVSQEEKPLVAITCYCFNPNHFHFIVKQEVDGGISEFFKRLLGGYTKYFNAINNRSGSLFQGTFKSHLIDNDKYFSKIYPYVNMNYLIHKIPKGKNHLVWASDKEYNSGNFDIISKEEVKNILDVYGSAESFKKECLQIISVIRQERGNTSLFEKDLLP
ncbi:MAG: hypothetical protein A2908_00335 [Candidatus Staskawiczbacteria bacterium RIFCSPLOWO2_01_FULL_38_12b]|uniref:Transposase IS200-like domain-containing protein n=1 Tax=Candidatus Staskawiczbacteria bacterium RIFCSPLOWO2_01_FULL_38_12b TaxID=1802214 RepID=A0A1G2IDL9_9BACT|nr:MAG: hypothetical protein A2908_00335 [Candidatus Staskawiczbacteria bacterium RIFCSPLOWO2_01_FULL_38_12b]